MTNDQMTKQSHGCHSERSEESLIAIVGHAKAPARCNRGYKLHMSNHITSKFAALDFSRTFHQPREIVGDAFARDRAAQSLENEIGSLRPAHVTEHHFSRKNHRPGI